MHGWLGLIVIDKLIELKFIEFTDNCSISIEYCQNYCTVYSYSVWEGLAAVVAALLKSHECSTVVYSCTCDHLTIQYDIIVEQLAYEVH